jgi:hypothetical protein
MPRRSILRTSSPNSHHIPSLFPSVLDGRRKQLQTSNQTRYYFPSSPLCPTCYLQRLWLPNPYTIDIEIVHNGLLFASFHFVGNMSLSLRLDHLCMILSPVSDLLVIHVDAELLCKDTDCCDQHAYVYKRYTRGLFRTLPVG